MSAAARCSLAGDGYTKRPQITRYLLTHPRPLNARPCPPGGATGPLAGHAGAMRGGAWVPPRGRGACHGPVARQSAPPPDVGGKALAGTHVVVPMTARAAHACDAYIGVGYARDALGKKNGPRRVGGGRD